MKEGRIFKDHDGYWPSEWTQDPKGNWVCNASLIQSRTLSVDILEEAGIYAHGYGRTQAIQDRSKAIKWCTVRGCKDELGLPNVVFT